MKQPRRQSDPHPTPPVAANGHAAPLTLQLGVEALAPMVRQVVAETLARLEETRHVPPERLAFPEAEAAALLGLHPHQLRDERLRGRVQASRGPGGKILYRRADLMDYLLSRRWQPAGQGSDTEP
jgi:hypothetical protein